MAVSDDKQPTVRKTITLSAASLRRLEMLAHGGWFGSDAAGVAASLIEAGLRRARSEGFLPDDRLEEDRSSKRGKHKGD